MTTRSKHVYSLILMLFSTNVWACDIDCENAITTIEINQCAASELKAAEKALQRYIDKSLQHHGDDQTLLKSIKKAQTAWLNYATAHCESIYTQWRDGTIRGVMALSCKTQLTKQRTHEIWSAFLTFMDSSPPILPEPER